MRARRVSTALLVVTVLLSGTVAVFAGRGQSATISGQVVTADRDAAPIRRAIVTLTGGSIRSNLSAVTDDDGRFRFVDLVPGRYTLSVAKAGYLTMTHGATRPGRPGVSLALSAGQQIDVRLPLPKGAVITGTVRDEFGQPVSSVRVNVIRAALASGGSGYRASADTLLTDDRGVYRAYGLMPDEYVVAAVPRSGSGTRLGDGEFDAQSRALEVRQTGAAGGSNAAGNPPAVEQESVAFAPTFFPSTVIATNAGRIRVAPGEEHTGIDIVLAPVRVSKVSGVIVGGGDIDPRRMMPRLVRQGPALPGIFEPLLSGPSRDGRFSVERVVPGRYTLLVATGPGAMMASEDARSASTINQDVPALFAIAEFDVTGADITGLTLSLRPATTMSGRLVFAPSSAEPPAPSSIRVGLARAGPGDDGQGGGGRGGGVALPSAFARDDGSFELVGVIPGEYTVVAPVTAGWRLHSVMSGGRDLIDVPLVVDGSAQQMADVLITYTDRRSELAGTLTTSTGQPATEFTVIAFPVDRRYWRPGARRIKTARPATNGAFSIMDLPAGEYLVAALTDFDQSDLMQGDYLEPIVLAAVKVVIADGQRTRQDLRIAR